MRSTYLMCMLSAMTFDLVPLQCQAKAKSTGNKCGKAAIPGGSVCRVHGGAAPQVKAKAADRLTIVRDLALQRLQEKLEDPTEGALMDPKVQLDIVTKLTKDIELLSGRATDRRQVEHAEKDRIMDRLQDTLNQLGGRREEALRVIDGGAS